MSISIKWAPEVSSGGTMLITELAQQPAILIFGGRGHIIAQNLATGAAAGGVYFYVIMDPVLTINPAINLKGRYRLGQWNNPQTGYYNTWDAPGAFNGFSEGQWTMFWAQVSLPWGTLGVGKRPWIFGNGLQYDGNGWSDH